MNSLNKIGFYTLTDERAQTANSNTSIERAEIILTDKCNFNCKYCRGIQNEYAGDLSSLTAKNYLFKLNHKGLNNIRFSGGEPTLYNELESLVYISKKIGVKRIAVSTNGSANFDKYKSLIKAGVNDFSISLDACCSMDGDSIAGKKGSFDKVVTNIKKIAKRVYTTVGIVLNENNIHKCKDIIEYAHTLGVSDIRIISSAQFNKKLPQLELIDKAVTKDKPILRYRINNMLTGRNVRGLGEHDCNRCGLVLDDITIAGNYHFPCIIYFREGGKPIGRMSENVREDRLKWYRNHNSQQDIICKNNCLDVCIDYNNMHYKYNNMQYKYNNTAMKQRHT